MNKRTIAIIVPLFLLALPAFSVLAEDTLIQNGGFEAPADSGGIPEGWFKEAWYEDGDTNIASVENGTAHIASFGNEGNDIRLCQTISVESGSYYKLSCMVKTSEVYGGNGANISVNESLATSAGVYGTNDWQTIELVGVTGSDQHELTVCVRLGGYGALSSGEAWFDNVSVEKLEGYAGVAEDFSAASVSVDTNGNDDYDSESTEGDFPYIGKVMLVVMSMAFVGIIVYRRYIETEQKAVDAANKRPGDMPILCVLILLGFAIRVALSIKYYGHSTDINCFMAWGKRIVDGGISNFYTSGMFADYPPGYMYVLCLTASIAKKLNLSYGSDAYVLLTKMPGIIADLISAYVVYKLAKNFEKTGCPDAKRWGRLPLVLAAVVALNPLYAFISGGWGQIDQILALLLLLVIWLFSSKKDILSGLVYGIAIVVKPQALMLGPLLAVAYFCRIYDERDSSLLKQILKTVAAVLSAVAAIFLISLPFKGNQQPLWFLSKILGTATSYNYGSIEAFNLMALLGGNWTNADNGLIVLSYAQLGTVLMILSISASAALYIKGRNKNKGCLMLSAAFQTIALFELGHFMHERYIIPALLLLLCAFVYYRDRRLFVSFIWLCAAAMFNACLAFIIVDHRAWRTDYYTALMVLGCIMNLSGFVYLSIACFNMVFKGVKRPAFAEKKLEREKPIKLPEPTDNKLNYSKKDKLFVIALTAVYAIIALINLGTTVAPENYWTGTAGDSIAITLEEDADIADIWVYGGLYSGNITICDQSGNSVSYDEVNGDMFRWKSIGGGLSGNKLILSVNSGSVWFNEIALFDNERHYVKATADQGAEALFDEADTVPERRTYMYGMYFDELYHARTAYEHLHGIKPYENSHPPLGKVFIMLGIAIFGMNAFGWRVMGALFGIGMVPIMYAFAKRLFKNSDYSLVAAGLFAFDFMHYTQTRIATIDVYGVFFIILMYYYMYQYFTMNFFVDGLKKTLKPLGIAGLFFGLGAASKWIDIYAGVGLAVILFASLIKRYIEYRSFKNSKDEAEREAVKPFWQYTIKTLLWCCVFYILVPVVIYLASYIPYVLCEEHYDLNGIWGVQQFMFSYHSGLKATHPYQSPWWQWPLIIRPMWYYVTYDVPEGCIGTISAMGNPAVWWVCCVVTATVIIKLIRGRIKPDKEWAVLLIGLAAEYIPWVLVPRCTFIYHYFASVPFIVLISVRALMFKEQKDEKYRWLKWVWLAAAIALFALFYPAITGIICSKNYIKMLEWLPSWTFLGY